MLIVKSFSMIDTIIVVSIKLEYIEMPSMIDILVPTIISPMKQVTTPASPQGGIYFDGQ